MDDPTRKEAWKIAGQWNLINGIADALATLRAKAQEDGK